MPVALVGLIASAGIGGLVTAGGALTLGGTVLAGVIGIGLSEGISAIRAALFPPSKAPPAVIKSVIRQSVASRKKHFGWSRIGGSLVLIETDSVGTLHQVLYMGEGPILDFEAWFIDDKEVHPEGANGGFVREQPYDSRMAILHNRGSDGNAPFAGLVDRMPTRWTPDHRGRGCVCAWVRQGSVPAEEFTDVYPNRIATVNAVGYWGLVYEPRNATRVWTANLALILREYLEDSDGMGIGRAYIDNEEFGEAANVCDALLETADPNNFINRYYGALSYSLDDEPQEVLSRLITATCGRLYLKPEGKVGFKAGIWEEPTVHITDMHVISYEMQDRSGPLREANEIIVKWTNPRDNKFAEVTAKPYRDEVDIGLSGRIKSVVVDAFEIQHNNHAARVEKFLWHRLNARWQGTIVTNLYGMKAWDQRWIRLTLADFPGSDGITRRSFEVLGISLDDATMTVTLQLASMDASALAFDARGGDEGEGPPDPVDVPEPAVPVPDGVMVEVMTTAASGNTRVVYVAVTWAAVPNRADLTTQVQISRSDEDSFQPIPVAESVRRAESGVLEDGATYRVRLRFVAPSGKPGNWREVGNIVTIVDSAPPDDPIEVAAALGLSGVTAVISWANPNSPNHQASRIYHTDPDDPGVTLIATIYGAPSQAGTFETGVLQNGMHRFHVAAVNGSGVEGAWIAAPPVDVSRLVFADDFNRADGALGATYARFGSADPAVVAASVLAFVTTGEAAYAVDVGTADHWAQARVRFSAGHTSFPVAVRLVDNTTFVGLRYNGGQWQIFKRDAGTLTSLGSHAAPFPPPGTVMRIDAAGGVVTVRIDGVTVIGPVDIGVAEGGLLSATGTGFVARAVTNPVLDNFETGRIWP